MGLNGTQRAAPELGSCLGQKDATRASLSTLFCISATANTTHTYVGKSQVGRTWLAAQVRGRGEEISLRPPSVSRCHRPRAGQTGTMTLPGTTRAGGHRVSMGLAIRERARLPRRGPSSWPLPTARVGTVVSSGWIAVSQAGCPLPPCTVQSAFRSFAAMMKRGGGGGRLAIRTSRHRGVRRRTAAEQAPHSGACALGGPSARDCLLDWGPRRAR